ncbi:MAG: signal peptide peptidase SppA [Acidobacteriota bacterium]
MRRGVGLVVLLLLAAVALSAIGMAALMLMAGAEPAVSPGSVLVQRVGDDLPEHTGGTVFESLADTRQETLVQVVENLRKAKADSRVSSVVVSPANLTAPYWAKLQEVRDAIVDFRRSGKKAVAFLEYGGDREYFIASACDQIFLLPTSPLDLRGLATYDLFLRGTLDKIGAYADFSRIGDYKTAPNQLTETGYTPAHRDMRLSLNRDLYDQLITAIAEGRRKPVGEVRRLLDEGPFLPEEALRAGLVDAVAYEDELDDKVELSAQKKFTRLDGRRYADVSLSSVGLGGGPKIAVLYAVGAIVSGRSGIDPLNGPVVGSDTLVEHIRTVRADKSVRAIVVRVDSPGGSSVASDVIWRELRLTAEGAGARPVVASMSDLAASGGYYIAMAAGDIVAQPATLTGSIGIYAGKIVMGGTYEKLGMGIESLSEGRSADMYSPVRPFSQHERAKLDEQLQAFYAQFIEKVAVARRMSPDEVDGVARGRVWTGRQAKEIGLVDELGGLDRAVALAKERAKIPASQEVELVVYPRRKSLYQLLAEQFGLESRLAWPAVLLRESDRRAVGALSAPWRLFREGEPLALMPYVIVR